MGGNVETVLISLNHITVRVQFERNGLVTPHFGSHGDLALSIFGTLSLIDWT